MTRSAEDQTEASDEMLMVRYQRGNREAFATLVGRHSADVFSLSYYLLGDENAAERVARETFRHVARDAEAFHLESQFRAWLFGITHRLVMEACTDATPNSQHDWSVRKLSRLEPPPADSALPPASSRAYRSQLLIRRVAARVSSLPLEMREAFLLKQVAQLSIPAIADVMGIDADMARQLIRLAFDRIQESVADTEEYARALR
jgi:RNA polymerase sigma-70 factor, ECF subfamily